MRSAAPIVLTLALVTVVGAANRLRLVREDDSTADAGPEKRPVPEIQVFDDFSSIGPEQRDAWLSIWSTQAWAMLQSLQAGRDKAPLHLLMVGDSTMRKQKAYLCDFLEPGVQHDFHGPEMVESSCFNRELKVRVTHLWSPCCRPDDLRHLAQRLADEGSVAKRALVEPQVVYHNCGLHLMHLGAFRPFECLPRPYEEVITGFQRALQEVYPSTLQVVMTTHSICEPLFTGGYRDAVDQAHWNPEALTDACVKDLSQRLWRAKDAQSAAATRAAPEGVTRVLAGLCRNGMMIDDTAARQRAAALKAVDAARRRGGGVGIDVVDAYALTWQQCWASEKMDGRHYPFLVPLEAQQFLAVVSRWLGGGVVGVGGSGSSGV